MRLASSVKRAQHSQVFDLLARAGPAVLRADQRGPPRADRRTVCNRKLVGRFCNASEGARMKNTEANPPRWAETILPCLLKPSDRDSTVGDLLEEYRAVRRPSLGAVRANVWYIVQVLSILWRLIQPAVLVMAVQSVYLALTVFRPGHHAPHPPPMGLPTLGSIALSIVWYGSLA